jgi:hypothetical protein
MPDWYQIALEGAIDNHDPERYEGRTWPELSVMEQEAAILVSAEHQESY